MGEELSKTDEARGTVLLNVFFSGHMTDDFISPEELEAIRICLEIALDTTKKWNLKHHLSDRLSAM